MKVVIEIEIPIAKVYCIDDEFKFTEFIAKKLTRQWFGCGCFKVKILKKVKGKMIPKWLENACEEIDAGFFSGDTFENEGGGEEARKQIKWYMGRWSRWLDKHESEGKS